jgi:Sec-independent protein translocase protein TatA
MISMTNEMFGISLSEFFVIFLVAVLVVPVRMWPDVARALARAVNAIRSLMWKITDVSENLKQQIDLEKPLDDLIQNTTDDVLNAISDKLPKKKNKTTKTKKVSK